LVQVIKLGLGFLEINCLGLWIDEAT